MKILYAIQGTGNGHMAVALEVLPYLMKRAAVDILVSGTEAEVVLPFPVKYQLHGLCFVFGKKGGIDYLETFKKARLKRFFREVSKLPVQDYDLVISDFEPISAWACYLRNCSCVGFSHQLAVINKAAPRPRKTDLIGQAVLRYYAPATVRYGFHFVPYNKNIFTPIIRSEIREAKRCDEGHYTVYLPAFSDKRISKLFSCFPQYRFEIFSKRCDQAFAEKNLFFYPINNKQFVRSLVSSAGVFCGAGFQTPSEALFLKKKLLVIPMKGQYEQQCNAAALKLLGVPVLKNIRLRQYKRVKSWLETDATVSMDFPDETLFILDELLTLSGQPQPAKKPGKQLTSFSAFRTFLVKKIFYQLGT